MTLSRKEFFRQGFFALGDSLMKAGEAVRGMKTSLLDLTVTADSDTLPVTDATKVARASNQYCLAKNCGCFSCIERCDSQAIQAVAGEGVRIDADRCCGCGTCVYVCPVSPKAIIMGPREQK